MKISLRAENTQASPIRKLAPFALKAKEDGKTILHLNIGQPDIETPEEALEEVLNYSDKILAYSPSDGFNSLKLAVSSYLKHYDVNLNESDINITTGGSEAILFAIASVCDPYDNILIPEPFYANYKSFAVMLNVNIIPVTTCIKDNFHIKAIADFESKIDDKTRAILICNPSNPTGVVYTQAEIEMLGELAEKYNLFVISDEVYREFLYDGAGFVSPINIKGLCERVIITDSISKRYSSCGARIGYIASKNRDVMNAVLKFSMARLSPPTIEQKLAERAFKIDFSYFDKVVKEYKNRRDVLIEELGKIDGISFSKPEGAFYMIVKLNGINSEDFARFLLTDFSIDNETVMVAPAKGFYETDGYGSDEIRIAYILDQEKIRRAVKIIHEGLIEFRNR